MKVAQDFYIYVVIDSRGAIWVGIAPQADTVLRVNDLQDREGNPLDAEMEAYLILGWGSKYGLHGKVEVRTIEIEIPAG